ncbi:hypothetical protein EDB83DRAFT_2314240 [Lactarius deliciosus]|nr:hypothetical protein EDB83DRAFT_2314240 [Lactarius deliciosus]
MVFADVGVLLLAAKDVAASQGILVDIFRRFLRLARDLYGGPTNSSNDEKKMMEITVEALDILAMATKEMEQSRAIQKNYPEGDWTDLEDGLRELEELINKEVAMSSVQLVNVTHKIDNKVAGIDDGVRGVDVKVQVVNDNVKAVGDRVQTITDGAQGLISDPPASSPVLSSRRQGNRDGSEINPPTNGGRRGQPEAFVISPVFADSRVSNTVAGNQLRTALGNGNLHQIRSRITTSPAIVNMREPRNGSLKVTNSKAGRGLVPCCEFTGNRAQGRLSYGSSLLKSCSIAKLMIVE